MVSPAFTLPRRAYFAANRLFYDVHEPQPAYTTVGTFLKILEAKGFVEHRRVGGSGRTFVYSPLLTRERYVTQVLRDVKDNIFGSSVKKMLSFFVQSEEIDEEELREILEMVGISYASHESYE